MRPWRIRLALRRSRIQWALLSVVLLVSTLAATLLATLYLLAQATETFAARSALDGVEPTDVRVVHRVVPTGPLSDVVSGSDEAASELFGPIPYSTSLMLQGGLLAVPREDEPIALGYLAYADGLEDLVSLRAGEWPAEAGAGPIQAIVPTQFLYAVDANVGDVVDLAPVLRRSESTEVQIVGTYAAKEPGADDWRYDRFQGAGVNPQTIVPFTGGSVTTDGYGPLFTVRDAVESFPVDTAIATYVPDFAGTSTEQLRGVVERWDSAERKAVSAIGSSAQDITVTSNVDGTLGSVIGSLAVTRSSVLVTGLLLLVLAVAALGQTARLMAERRHGEQHLMIARGGSGRQIFRLGLIEAVVLGAITAGAAAPLARQAYLGLSSVPTMERAGMHRDPGLPWPVWAVTGLVGLVLIVVLVAPLMRRSASFVEAEQVRSRPGRRAAFQRSGIDIALVALAGLAYWQLRSYESPVLASGGVATVDPLLAAGPALALLAGAFVAVRLIPAASKLLEGLAARGRKAVMPLAAWEVGRRAARAVSAILLLTLAVSIGTFAMAFLTSWHQSQEDQALYLQPSDVVVTGVDGAPLAQASLVDGGDADASVAPVYTGTAQFGTVDESPSLRGGITFSGRDIQILAAGDDALKALGVGRLNEAGGARIAAELAHGPATANDPIELPGKPDSLRLTVTANHSTTGLSELVAVLRAVVQDAHGQLQTVSLGAVPVDGESRTLTAPIATTSDLAEFAWPLSLVGFQASWLALGEEQTGGFGSSGPLTMTLAFDDLEAITPVSSVPVDGVPAIVDAAPLDIPDALDWSATGAGARLQDMEREGHDLQLRAVTSEALLRFGASTLAITAAAQTGSIPVVISGGALDAAGYNVGDQVQLFVNASTVIDAYVAQRVPTIAGDTLGRDAVAVNWNDLQLALVQKGATTVAPSQWWATVAADDLDAYVASLPPGADASTRAGIATSLQEDPLRIAIPAALWLVTGAAVVLAAVGFAVHAVVTVRAREIEFAQLRAVGIQRGQLLRVVGAESTLLSVLGAVFGVGLGVALSYLVAPLVSVGADGRPPVPPVIVQIPWTTVGLLALEVGVVLALTILLVSVLLRRINPAQMLRLGEER